MRSFNNKLSSIFVERLNERVYPAEDVNYNEESVKRSVSAANADVIATHISNSFGGEEGNLVIAASGIGSVGLAAFENRKINHIWLNSENTTLTRMLEENFKSYGFGKEVYTVTGVPFTAMPNEDDLVDAGVTAGSKIALYMDFSWTDDLTVSNRNVNEWINELSEKGLTRVFFRYPAGKDFPIDTGGFVCAATSMGAEGTLFECSKGPKSNVPSMTIDDFMGTPLKKFLQLSGATATQVEQMGTDRCKKVWESCFRDKTIDMHHNMDSYALIGKNLWRFALSKYMMKRFPAILPDKLCEAVEYYSSVVFIAPKAKSLGGANLTSYFSSKLNVIDDMSMMVKLFYSFIGGMVTCANMELGDPHGDVIANNFVRFYMNGITGNRSFNLENTTTLKEQVNTFMRDVYADKPTVGLGSMNGIYFSQVYLNDTSGQLAKLGLPNGSILGSFTGGLSGDVSLMQSYARSLSALNTAISQPDQEALQRPTRIHGDLFEKVSVKALSDNTTSIYFSRVYTDGSRYFVRLIGFVRDRTNNTVAKSLSHGIGYSRILAEREALNEYIKQ